MFMSHEAPVRRTLADIIQEKITEKKTEIQSQMSGANHHILNLYYEELYFGYIVYLFRAILAMFYASNSPTYQIFIKCLDMLRYLDSKSVCMRISMLNMMSLVGK